MVSTLQASIMAFITAAASIAVGFGFFGGSTEHIVISVAGIVVGAVFAILNEVKGQTLIKAGRALELK
jgi:hypothetical protein